MRRLFTLQAVLAVVLMFLVAVEGSRVLERHVGANLRLGGSAGAGAGLKPSTRRYLDGLKGRVTLTYFVSSRAAMPSWMKGLEESVRSLLERIKAAAPDRVDYRVLDPDLDHERGPNYASGKSASPMKARKVLADESSEAAVWSSLCLAHDQFTDALIQGIRPADLPYLEDLIVENLKAAESPVQAVVAVASPKKGYSQVRELMKSFANVRIVDADLDREPHIPPEADFLLWIDPQAASREHQIALDRFLRSGRSAIVAGATHSIEYADRAGKTSYSVRLSPCPWKTLLQPFGVGLAPLLVLDKNHEGIAWSALGGKKIDAPFHLRIFPSLYDTKHLLGPPAGALLVCAPSPIQWDPRAVAAGGRSFDVVATTTEHARVLDLPDTEFDDAFLDERAAPVPKQPWMGILTPRDAWQGDLLVVGSPILFHDDPYAQGGNANQVFLRTLLRTFTHPSRLARIRVERREPPALPSLSVASRLFWRGAAVFLVPVGFFVVALRISRERRTGPRDLRGLKLAVSGALGFALLLVVVSLWRRTWDPHLDLTEDRINTPSPTTERILAPAREGLAVDLLASDETRMPASLKGLERRVVSSLRALGLRPRIVRPEELDAGEQKKLRAAGILPFDVETVEDDAPVSARVWCSLRLERAGKTTIVPRIDDRAAEHLEFLLAAAAKRLLEGRTPRVGVLSDLPRLSPAEAHTDYQEKGYTAPIGSDVYGFAKRLLADHGYDVVYINPESPVFPEGMDVLVWLQPRYPWKAWEQFAKFLEGGGKVFAAVQHYNVQQRQYRGIGFETVYWPQPQFHGFNDFLTLIGVREIGEKLGEQPGEVLFDRNHADLVLATQVNRSAFREHDPQQVSRPFLIRVAPDGMDARSVITSRLGSLLFIWGNRISLDEAALRKLGIAVTVLASTSPISWIYAWKGGYLPEKPPDSCFDETGKQTLGRQPLAVLLEGMFPRIKVEKDATSGRETPKLDDAPNPQPKPSKLVLVGCSEMFKDPYLFLPGYQHDQLLLDSVAFLGHGEDLAAVQARVRVQKSFPYQPAGVKLRWRAVTVGLPPLLFVLYGLVRALWRRRPVLSKT